MPTTQLKVSPCRAGLTGSVPLPADPDILERAILFASLGSEPCKLAVARPSANLEPALGVMEGLGVRVLRPSPGLWEVTGSGLRGLHPQSDSVDVTGLPVLGNGLLACLAAQPFASRLGPFESTSGLDADARSLNLRGATVSRVERHAQIGGFQAQYLAPLEVRLPMRSTLAKHVCLMSGLYADGMSIVHEPLVSVDHTERMLSALGGTTVDLLGPVIRLRGPAPDSGLAPFDFDAPGSAAAAAYLLAAAALVEGSHITVRDACLNPTRSGFLEGLRMLGTAPGVTPRFETLGESVGEITLKGSTPSGCTLGGELVQRLSHELCALVAVAALASGSSEFCDLELILPAGDVNKIVGFLRSFGVQAEGSATAISVQGLAGQALRATRVTTGGDPHLAALGVLLALRADGDSVIDNVDCLAEFLPRFVGTLKALGAQLEVVT